MQRKRLPGIVDGSIWEKVTRGQAKTRWDREVERVWKVMGRNQDKTLSIGSGSVYTARLGDMMKIRGRVVPRRKANEEEHLKHTGD